MRDLLADFALRRAKKAARTCDRLLIEARSRKAGGSLWTPAAERALARSYWWHDIAAWLDGFGNWPGLRARSGEDA